MSSKMLYSLIGGAITIVLIIIAIIFVARYASAMERIERALQLSEPEEERPVSRRLPEDAPRPSPSEESAVSSTAVVEALERMERRMERILELSREEERPASLPVGGERPSDREVYVTSSTALTLTEEAYNHGRRTSFFVLPESKFRELVRERIPDFPY